MINNYNLINYESEVKHQFPQQYCIIQDGRHIWVKYYMCCNSSSMYSKSMILASTYMLSTPSKWYSRLFEHLAAILITKFQYGCLNPWKGPQVTFITYTNGITCTLITTANKLLQMHILNGNAILKKLLYIIERKI